MAIALVVGALVTGSIAWWAVAPALLGGAVLWTLLEYVVHRFVFHADSEARLLVLLRRAHALHHDHPDDPMRILIHPVLTAVPYLLVLIGLTGICALLGQAGVGLVLHAGLTLMWLTYSLIHWRMHCGPRARTGWWSRLRQHHLRHHFDPRCEDSAYGVTTTLWDRLGGTRMPREPAPTRFEVWPRSRRDVVRYVRQATQAGVRLRAVGAQRSFSEAREGTCTVRTELLTGLTPLPEHLSGRDDLVQVRAGTRVSWLIDRLAERGRALENHAAWTGQSVMGAIATASHGTGLAHPPMCDLVVSVVVVTGSGRVVRIEPGHLGGGAAVERGVERRIDDDLFHAVVAGFGCFGVVTEVVLRTRPSVWLEEHREARIWSEVRAMVEGGALERWPWFQVLVNPYATGDDHTCVVTLRRPIEVPPGTRPDRRQRWLPVLFSRLPLDRVLTGVINAAPSWIPGILDRALRATVRRTIRGPMHRILDNRPLNTAADAHAFEHGVPAEQGLAAVERVLTLARTEADRGRWLTAPISLRYTAPSAHLLAPQHGGATAMVEVIALRRARWGREVLRPFARAVGGRPHWGLDVLTLQGPEDVRRLWPGTLDRWLAARERLAPGPAFDAPFTDRLGLSEPAPELPVSLGRTAPVVAAIGPWRWARSLLADPRDVTLLRSLLVASLAVPAAAVLYLSPIHPLWLAPAYAVLVLASLGRIALTLHVVNHRPLLRPGLRGLERVLLGTIGALYGHVPGAWAAHHVAMHHPCDNGPEDLSTTTRARRDSRTDFARYLLAFHLGILPRLFAWHGRRHNRIVRARLAASTLSFWAVAAALAWLNPWAFVITLVVPILFVRSAMAAGNWAQHAFLHPRTPLEPWGASVTLVHARSNEKRFNDGFHATHHDHPSAHYSEHPLLFLAEARERLDQGAVVLSGVPSFPGLWVRLMRGDLEGLEAQRVPAGQGDVPLAERLEPLAVAEPLSVPEPDRVQA